MCNLYTLSKIIVFYFCIKHPAVIETAIISLSLPRNKKRNRSYRIHVNIRNITFIWHLLLIVSIDITGEIKLLIKYCNPFYFYGLITFSWIGFQKYYKLLTMLSNCVVLLQFINYNYDISEWKSVLLIT